MPHATWRRREGEGSLPHEFACIQAHRPCYSRCPLQSTVVNVAINDSTYLMMQQQCSGQGMTYSRVW